ncbi:MAG TPA: YtxH domain-containing protein [Bryobacteraceae bacterium]|nr:YtxH domain-containing protein [Bryobacteraceae bacterium]
MERENSAALIVWFVGGAVLGATVALLIAPQSGARTRRVLRKKAVKGKKSLMESSQDIVSRGRELYERGREIAEETAELFERGRKIAEKTVEERL